MNLRIEFSNYLALSSTNHFPNLEIYVAITLTTMQQYYADKPEIASELIAQSNIRVYVFDNLTPYKIRIGINTDLESGFVCAYFGHRDEKVDLEGIKSDNPIFLEIFETLFLGLLTKGVEITENNLHLIK